MNFMPALTCCVTLGDSFTLSKLQASETGVMVAKSAVRTESIVCKAPRWNPDIGSYRQHHQKARFRAEPLTQLQWSRKSIGRD